MAKQFHPSTVIYRIKLQILRRDNYNLMRATKRLKAKVSKLKEELKLEKKKPRYVNY
jgi:hypothetical protein